MMGVAPGSDIILVFFITSRETAGEWGIIYLTTHYHFHHFTDTLALAGWLLRTSNLSA